MVFFNYTTMQMTAKIVYYGPGLGGKTTNLQFIHRRTAPTSRGEMISLETETDRTLFFDLLPIDVGVISGMKVRLQLYTVPGQVFYNATRKLVLKGVDGIVFVADSQTAALGPNVESLRNLEENLAELNLDLNRIPFVIQYNKRDILSIHSVEKLNETLNPQGFPNFEAAALHGVGVFETLKTIARLAIQAVRHKLDLNFPATPSVSAIRAAPAPQAAFDPEFSFPEDPEPEVEAEAETRLPELNVEFAEEAEDRRELRPVSTKGSLDIHAELERLRTMAQATPRPAPRQGAGMDRRLQELLLSERDAKQELKRKSGVEVPAELLRTSSGLRLQLVFEREGDAEVVHDVAAFKLVGNKRLQSLLLRLDLDIKGK